WRERVLWYCAAGDGRAEPVRRDRVDPVERAQQRAGDGRVRVGVAAESDHVAKPLLEVELFARDLQRDPGGKQGEPHVGPVDLARSTGLAHQELELLATLAVVHDPEPD